MRAFAGKPAGSRPEGGWYVGCECAVPETSNMNHRSRKNHRTLRSRGLLAALVAFGAPLAASCGGHQESNVGSAQQASVMAGFDQNWAKAQHNIRGDEGWDEAAPIQVSFGYDD